MPPKRTIPVQPRSHLPPPSPAGNRLTSTYRALTAPENASVVRSVAIFGVSFFPPTLPACLSLSLSPLSPHYPCDLGKKKTDAALPTLRGGHGDRRVGCPT